MSMSMPSSGSARPPSAAVWRYGMPAIVLHWMLAALIAFMVSLGWYMMAIEKQPQGPWYFDLHTSVGLVVAALVALRISWRLFHRPAPLPAGLPAWQVRLSKITHWLLYAGMIVMPLTGFIGASYRRSGVTFFTLHLPSWSLPDRALSHLFFSIHSATAWVLVGLVVLHTAAGLKHLLIDRDAVFLRMWFQARR